MTFADAASEMVDVVFDTFSETASLNGSDVDVVRSDKEVEESGDGMADVLEIEFKASDYATITYRTDTLEIGGVTWRYPTLVSEDGYTKRVRFRRNVRPRAGR